MNDVMMTLVFMLVFIAFMIWPAIKIVEFIDKKTHLKPKTSNFLILFFTLALAFSAALFMKMT